jgi:adenylate cyclase
MQSVVLNSCRRQGCSFCRVIPEIDIWRAANLMLKRYGEKALEESEARADELAAADDYNAVAVWRRIKADFQRAEALIGQALAASPRDWLPHYAKGALLRWQGRCEEAILEYETAFELNPNWLNSLDQLAWCKMMTGSIDEAIPLEERAIRLSPHDPAIGNFYSRIGLVQLLESHLDEAILWHERSRSANPGSYFPHAYLASEYALKGELARASVELAEARRLVRDARLSSIVRVEAAGTIGGPGYWGVPKVRALFEATYFAGLRKAGMPEE